MYEPASRMRRTAAERADQRLSWQRDDRAFFAAGACHILAWSFAEQFPFTGFAIVALRRVGEPHAFHVYVSDGTWAFDHDGFTPEVELLAATESAEGSRSFERLAVTSSLDTFCVEHHHRPPAEYAKLPWDRARKYISQFPWPLPTSVPPYLP